MRGDKGKVDEMSEPRLEPCPYYMTKADFGHWNVQLGERTIYCAKKEWAEKRFEELKEAWEIGRASGRPSIPGDGLGNLAKRLYLFFENDTTQPEDCDECGRLRGGAMCSWHKNVEKFKTELKVLTQPGPSGEGPK